MIIIYILIALFVIWTLAPYLWTINASFSNSVELTAKPPHWLPREPTLENYKSLLGLLFRGEAEGRSSKPLFTNMFYSFIVASITTLICLILGCFSAYAFARLRFRGNAFSFRYLIYQPCYLLFFIYP